MGRQLVAQVTERGAAALGRLSGLILGVIFAVVIVTEIVTTAIRERII